MTGYSEPELEIIIMGLFKNTLEEEEEDSILLCEGLDKKKMLLSPSETNHNAGRAYKSV